MTDESKEQPNLPYDQDPTARRTHDRPRADVGSVAWGKITHGRLTRLQTAVFAASTLPEIFLLLRTHARLKRGRRGSTEVDPNTMTVPDTPLCRAAQQCARRHYAGGPLERHAYRTVAYAQAIASMDHVEVDPELLWCAALLHDVGLPSPVAGHCFAVRGGETAQDLAIRAGVSAARSTLLAEAISRHPMPGLNRYTQPLAYLVNVAALLDLTGRRLDNLSSDSVAALLDLQTRAGLEETLNTQWEAEAAMVPHGRPVSLACSASSARPASPHTRPAKNEEAPPSA